MIKLFKYLFWVVYYWALPTPRSFEGCLHWGTRTKWPWIKFKPFVWHNDDSGFWHVWLSNEGSHTVAGKALVNVDIHISKETGKVVGFDVKDEVLVDLAKELLPMKVYVAKGFEDA